MNAPDLLPYHWSAPGHLQVPALHADTPAERLTAPPGAGNPIYLH